MERICKGDLVTIKKTAAVGIVVDIEMRSEQNPDWDILAVLLDGSIKEMGPRRLIKIKKSAVKSVKLSEG
jgi:hypothetical protein